MHPEIPWNTGNAGRTCLALGARLHLVEPLGFSLGERGVRRAGLDYWAHVAPEVWPSWVRFREGGPSGEPWLVTPEGERAPWEVELGPAPVLVFGAEAAGLPAELREAFPARRLRIPMVQSPVRSLNVSTTVGMLLMEVTRQAALRSPD